MSGASPDEISWPTARTFGARPHVALFIADARQRMRLEPAVAALNLSARWHEPGAGDAPDAIGPADLVVWTGSPPPPDVAATLLERSALGDFRLLVGLPDNDLDAWTDVLGRRNVDVVIASDLEALVTAMGRAPSGRLQRARQSDDDPIRRLRDLGDEVARIAQALAASSYRRGEVSEPRNGYRAQPNDAGGPVTPAAVRAIIRARRLRDQFFSPDLFADPAWDILLDLVAARLEGNDVAVSSLCIAAAVPPTTALRWIAAMTEQGLLERHADPADRRRVFVRLSAEAEERMRGLLGALARMGAGMV
jgi:DNA-binding MarR family transcriptional regulator